MAEPLFDPNGTHLGLRGSVLRLVLGLRKVVAEILFTGVAVGIGIVGFRYSTTMAAQTSLMDSLDLRVFPVFAAAQAAHLEAAGMWHLALGAG